MSDSATEENTTSYTENSSKDVRSANKQELLKGLSKEERRLLELHQSSRPAQGWEKKKAHRKTNRKHRRKGFIGLLTRAETYAVIFAAMPVLVLILGTVGVLAINQSMDLDLLQELSAEEGLVEDISETTSVGFEGMDAILWVQDNIVLVFLAISAVFFGIAALIMLFAKLIRAGGKDKEGTVNG